MRKQLIMLVCFLLTGCGTGQGHNEPLDGGVLRLDPIVEQPGSAELEAQLTAELQTQLEALSRLGASIQADTPPLGVENIIFDLKAELVESVEPEEGILAIGLTWTEQVNGDYDQNGEVGLSDIMPLVTNYGAEVEYEANADPESKLRIPVGDPDGDGAPNWYLARIDGDGNGVVGLSDVSAIAQHWQERVDGFEVLRKPISASDFETLPNAENPENPTLTRAEALSFFSSDGRGGSRMGYIDTVPAEIAFEYRVAAVAGAESRKGSLSNRAQLGIDLPPTVGLTASHSYYFPGTHSPEEITLDASSAVDPNGQTMTFAWDINGDGEYDIDSGESSAITYTYTWEDVGIRSVGVAVTDEGGSVATAEMDLFVLGAQFEVYPKFVNPGDTVTVDFSQNMNPVNPLIRVSCGAQVWEANPENPDSLPIFQIEIDNLDENEHATNYWYDNDGLWECWLQYVDQPSSIHGSIARGFDLNTAPLGECQLDKINGLPGLEVSFDASASHVGLPLYGFWLDQPDDSIINYEWDFGDGESFSSSEPLATHQFTNPGTKIVTLTATDSLGLSGTREMMITVFGSGNSWQFTDVTPINYTPDSYNSNRLVSQSGPGSRYNLASRFELSEVYNHLALAYTEWRDGELVLLYTYAFNAAGTSWSEPVEVYRPVTDCQLALMDIDGRPAIGFAIDDKPYFIRATGTEGSAWNPPVLMIDKHLSYQPGIELMMIDNHPAALICPNGNSRMFIVADDPLGSNWDQYFYGTLGSNLQSAIVVDGQPAFCGWYDGGSGLRFNRAMDLNLGPWQTPIYIGYEDRSWGNLPVWNELISGQPACLATERIDVPNAGDSWEIIYHRSIDPLGLTWSAPMVVDTWLPSTLPQGMVSLNGERPAISYLYKSSLWEPDNPSPPGWPQYDYCLAYMEALNASGTIWSEPTVLTSFSAEGLSNFRDASKDPVTSMVYMGNRPYIAYINPDTSMLSIAVRE